MDKIVYDGKWTFAKEWKQSALETIQNESNVAFVHIRTAHYENFLYVMLDVVADKTTDDNQDYAVVCFDAKNEQSFKPDDNDYCFMINVGSNKPITFQGSSDLNEFKIVDNHADLIAVGGTSDENDRYSKTPHTSFEFRIPIELFERNDHYGFFVKVVDYTKSQTYTWPSEIVLESISDIPSPDKWGMIYSPDKSLPEYDVPILVLVVGIFSIILLSIRNRGSALLKMQN